MITKQKVLETLRAIPEDKFSHLDNILEVLYTLHESERDKKTRELNALFENWKQKFPFKENDFHADGIINEELYELNPLGKKLLFIAKEPNATNREDNEDRNFVTEWNNENKLPTYNFAQRIADWTYGFMNDFPCFDDIKENEKLAYLKRVAFMNVKKSGGGGTAINSDIYKAVKEQKELIKEEIRIIEPDIILLCVSFDKVLIKELFGDLDFKKSGYGIDLSKFGHSKIINFYHPSSRNVAPAAYSLLQNVMRSKAFQNL